MSRHALPLALLGALVVAPVLARADAIMPPPSNCPVGAVGTSSHSGAWCVPADCGPTARCEDVMRSWSDPSAATPGRYACRAGVGVCVRTTQIPEGGMMAGQGRTVTKREALSSCTSNAGCPPDAPCELTAHCAVDASYVSPESPASRTFWERAFSCSDEPSAPTHRVGGIFLGLGGLGLAAVLLRRRR